MKQKDARYKITSKQIQEIKQLRSTGLSYAKIAEAIGNITWATAYYWANDAQRKKARQKNAQRRHTETENKTRIKRDMKTREKRWEENPNTKLAHEIRSALSDKRSRRKTVRGIPIEEAKRLLESGKLNTPNKKLD